MTLDEAQQSSRVVGDCRQLWIACMLAYVQGHSSIDGGVVVPFDAKVAADWADDVIKQYAKRLDAAVHGGFKLKPGAA
jgi:hypothetical protein